jgi:Tfp pilus assembly protein PilO
MSVIRNPVVRAALFLGIILALLGAVRAAFVDPRTREAKLLRSRGESLRAKLGDLEAGALEEESWAKEHPEGASEVPARRALPARRMVSGFLRALGPIAAKHGVSTQTIEPGRAEDAEAVAGGATYRKAELRLRIEATYFDLAQYLADVEKMDQVVLVRSVGIRFDRARYPELSAEVVFWVYGAS